MTEPKRKLTFQHEKGLGKLRLRFDDGELRIRLSKHRDAYTLRRDEAHQLALWLSAWSLKLMETAKADVAAPDVATATDAARGSKKKRKKKVGSDEEKKGGEPTRRERALALDGLHEGAGGSATN